jgi:cytochrome c553
MIPVIAGQHVSVLVKQLVDFRHDRRWDGRMQGAARHSELQNSQDLLDVAAYAESLKRPPPREMGPVDAATRQEGLRIYYRDCERCHGRLAEGDLQKLVPRLAGQNYPYLVTSSSTWRTASGSAWTRRISSASGRCRRRT